MSDKAQTKTEPNKESIKETIEQILIAFVMAFIFRCFLVEAFVIPTGSMAPTLLGQNMAFRCPDCGWQWKVNYGRTGGSSNDMGADPFAMDARQGKQAAKVLSIRCPNCGYKLPRNDPNDPANDATGANVRFGDRILVIKFGYLLRPPERWDVIVFKNPSLAPGIRLAPGQTSPPDAYQENYIKRLVGKPGETVMILDGDIYVANRSSKLADLKPEDFTIQTKSWDTQEALWRIVYDNDHQPIGRSRRYVSTLTNRLEWEDPAWQQPWTSNSSAWQPSGRKFELDPSQGHGEIHFDPQAVPTTLPLTDWLAYDVTRGIEQQSGTEWFHPGASEYKAAKNSVAPVSDLKLALTYHRHEGDGKLRLKFTKRSLNAIAELDQSGYAIKKIEDGNETTIASGTMSGIGEGGSRIEFTFVDYQATLRIDGRIVARSKPGDFQPNVPALLAEFEANQSPPMGAVAIEAEGGRATIEHLSLWRDIYYINRPFGSPPPRWAIPRGFPSGTGSPTNDGGFQLMQLGPGEYFVLGDNSYLSHDARLWYAPINLPDEDLHVDSGRVPQRFLIGKAFFVYWPSGFPVTGSSLRLVPNFGEMRFIK